MRTNSTSKTKKINVIRKNRIEKGIRALNLGEKPHSKGLFFSWSDSNFFLRLIPNKNTTPINTIKNISIHKKTKIFLKVLLNFNLQN